MPREEWDICMHCSFWHECQELKGARGECRRTPPRVPLIITMYAQNREFRREFPITNAKDYCGGFEPKFKLTKDKKKTDNGNGRK